MNPTKNRMPPIPAGEMDVAQQAAAAELIAGPRKAVKGPFIPLMRSPELLGRVQKLGEYLRFDSVLDRRVNEFATLVVSRRWRQEFEWFVHVPLARQAGVPAETVEALRVGQRPQGMHDDDALVYDLLEELHAERGLSDERYEQAAARFGERGVVELLCLAGYFTMLAMVMNVAGTPPETVEGVAPMP